MRRQRIFMLRILIILAVMVGGCSRASCAEVSSQGEANAVNTILDALSRKTNELRSYQCGVEYLFSQPVLESKTLKTGNLCYARFVGGSKLRINFDTLTQDEGPQQNYKECYIFDGRWLTHIDYQIKHVQKRQLAEANEPIDAFELAKRNFPLIGFSRTDELKREFEVNLVGPATARRLCSSSDHSGAYAETSEPNGLTHLHLKVKPDSIYKNDYKSVEVWIDHDKLGLPARISAVSTEGDIYEIKFVVPLVNEPVDEKVFEFTIPDGFGRPEIIPLKK
jgi:outer membrane lipoprotein-sorting protein